MSDFDERWAQRDEAIQRRVMAAINDLPRVIYAACPEDDEGMPRDNLDEVAHPGPLQLLHPATRQPLGTPLPAPTWLTLALQAHRLIDQLYGFEQRALVGLELLGEQDGAMRALLRLEQPQ